MCYSLILSMSKKNIHFCIGVSSWHNHWRTAVDNGHQPPAQHFSLTFECTNTSRLSRFWGSFPVCNMTTELLVKPNIYDGNYAVIKTLTRTNLCAHFKWLGLSHRRRNAEIAAVINALLNAIWFVSGSLFRTVAFPF